MTQPPPATPDSPLDPPLPASSLSSAAFALFALAALAMLSLAPLRPPPPLAADAPATEFSALRARDHVSALATEPHPMGSAAHGAVRDELVRRIEAVGVPARIQREVAVRPARDGAVRVAFVENVLTRLPGRSGDGAVLALTHYDSVSTGPGAADDAAGSAALLEALAVLAAGPELAHDVIFLWTDGEERGLLGARAFLDHHPWAADVRLVLNFEARGTRGPSIMFETGPGSGPLLARYARHAPRPVASSYSYDVYRYLPNDTDFTLFKEAGLPGFNFAFIEGAHHYHTTLDDLDHLSLDSLQHHGASALGLLRHFADAPDLGRLPRGGERVYFPLPLLGLAVYPASLALPLAALLSVSVIWLVARRARRRLLRPAGFLWGLLAADLAVLAAVGLVALAHGPLLRLAGRFPGMIHYPGLYLAGWALLAAALVAGLYLTLARRLGARSVLAGAVAALALLALLTAVALPSTSFLTLWPAVGAAVALGLLPDPASAGRRWGAATAAVLPAVLLLVPTGVLLQAALGAGGFGPPVVALVGALGALALLPLWLVLTAGRPAWRLPAVAAGIGLALVLVAVGTARYSADRPLPTSILYLQDADTGLSRWASFQPVPNRYTAQFLGGARRSDPGAALPPAPFFSSRFPHLLAVPAPHLPLGPPEVRPLPATAAGQRVLELHAPAATDWRIELASPAALSAITVGGRSVPLPSSPGPATLLLYGVPRQGATLVVEMAEDAPLEVTAVSLAAGLPEVPGLTVEPRDHLAIPHPQLPTDLTVIKKSYQFETGRDVSQPGPIAHPEVSNGGPS